MDQPTVLISGAGVAGPTLAFWLHRYGYRVIVVEIAAGVRPGGQTVDLRGAGRGVVERMGLLDAMTQRALDQRGAAWIKADGSRRAEMPVEAFNGNGARSAVSRFCAVTSSTSSTRRPRPTSTTGSTPGSPS